MRRLAIAAWRIPARAQGPARVADAEADQVADPVGEEQPHRAGLHQRPRFAAQDTEGDESLGDDLRRGHVDVHPLGAGHAALDGCAFGGVHHRVQLRLFRAQLSADRIRARDVRGVLAVVGARVDEDEVPADQPAIGGHEVQDGRVGAGADDRVVGHRVGARTQGGGLQLHLDRAFGAALHQERHRGSERGAGGALGHAHALELDLVLWDGGRRQARAADRRSAPGRNAPRARLRATPPGIPPSARAAAPSHTGSWPSGTPPGSPPTAPDHSRSSSVTSATKSNQPSAGSNAKTPPGRLRSVR